MGAYQAGNDPDIDEALASWPLLMEYVKQRPHELVDYRTSVAQLSEMFAT